MSKLIEKKLKSELIYNGAFLKIQRDQVETFDGKKRIREFVLHPGAAMIVPVLPNGDLLLERQYRHAVGKVFYEFPAGKIDRGENPYQTATRELREETGGVSGYWKFMTRIHPVIGYSNEFIDIFIAENVILGPSALDDDEYVEIVTMNFSELLNLVEKQEVTDVKTLVGIMWYEKFLNKTWKMTEMNEYLNGYR